MTDHMDERNTSRHALPHHADQRPLAAATAAEPATLIEYWEARDRVIANLRHRLCDLAHVANAETVKYKRERRFGEAFATGQCLEVVLRELGEPGDRTLPKPDGALPLNPDAEGEARVFLGVVADYLLGRQPVL